MSTRVVNIRTDQFDVYIGRGKGGRIPDPPERGCFGNPFSVQSYGRKGCIERFVVYFYDRVEQDDEFRSAVLALQGSRLGCHCKPEECHGDVIKQWLDEQLEST